MGVDSSPQPMPKGLPFLFGNCREPRAFCPCSICCARCSFGAGNGAFVFWFTKHWLNFHYLGRSLWGSLQGPSHPLTEEVTGNRVYHLMDAGVCMGGVPIWYIFSKLFYLIFLERGTNKNQEQGTIWHQPLAACAYRPQHNGKILWLKGLVSIKACFSLPHTAYSCISDSC